jgi:hypothetical protein
MTWHRKRSNASSSIGWKVLNKSLSTEENTRLSDINRLFDHLSRDRTKSRTFLHTFNAESHSWHDGLSLELFWIESNSPHIVCSISMCLAPSDGIEQKQYRRKLFVIWGSLHCLGLLLELASSKPEKNWSLSATWVRLSYFHCRKQGKVTEGQIMGREWVRYQVHTMFFEPICWSPTCVNWAIIKMDHK